MTDRNQATKETACYVHYKHMVTEAARLPEYRAKDFVQRIGTAFDMGEPVWMIADELRIRADHAQPKHKTPRQLAASVTFVS